MMMKNFLLGRNLWQLLSLLKIQEHPKLTQMQFPLERPKSTQIQSLFHTTTCGLVGETIPAPNYGLLPPACPGFRQTAARPACNYFFIYLFFRYWEGS